MHAHRMDGRRDARDARNAGGMDEKKRDGIDRCFGVARRSRARGDARNDACGRIGWMDELSTTGRDGTGRGEDAKTRTTD